MIEWKTWYDGLVLFLLHQVLPRYQGGEMDKAELRKMLDEQVAAKVGEGYTITTYAMDVASTDRVKRALGHHGHAPEHEDGAAEWSSYLQDVEAGTYVPETTRQPANTKAEKAPAQPSQEGSSGSVGLWKARRH